MDRNICTTRNDCLLLPSAPLVEFKGAESPDQPTLAATRELVGGGTTPYAVPCASDSSPTNFGFSAAGDLDLQQRFVSSMDA